jgi:hypothetical protein
MLRQPLAFQFAGFFSGAASGRRHVNGCGWQAMPMLEQAMTPLSRWQTMQRSVHTAQPGMPDCVDPPAPGCGNGAGPSSSVATGGGVEGAAAEGNTAGGAPVDDASGGAAEGGDAAGADAGGDGPAGGDAEDGGASAAGACNAATPTRANAATRLVMRAGAWVEEPRSIVSSSGARACPLRPMRASEWTVIGRRKDASRARSGADDPKPPHLVPATSGGAANGLGSATAMP